MGKEGLEGDRRRFLAAIRQANALRPAFVIVSGDVTHRRAPEEYAALEPCLAEIESPFTITPGNHDLLSPDDWEGLEAFRERFGPDYSRFAFGGAEFLCLNAMTLPAEQANTPSTREESRRQWEWLEGSLREIRSGGEDPVFLLLHVPPFVREEDETEEYFNLPMSARRKLLDLVRRFDIRTLIAGHTHHTFEIATPDFSLYTTGGTAVVFDDRGYGFRVFEVDSGRVSQRYVRLELDAA
jgi:3',5'-cyclic AMP phosphodiesterase CpdA